MFWRKKDDPGTAARKALLAYLKNLEQHDLIQWQRMGDKFSVKDVNIQGQMGELCVAINYSYTGATPSCSSIKISLSGNGVLDLDWKTMPKHSLWKQHPHITYILKRADKAIENAKNLAYSQERLAQNQEAEQSAQEILGHLSATSAS